MNGGSAIPNFYCLILPEKQKTWGHVYDLNQQFISKITLKQAEKLKSRKMKVEWWRMNEEWWRLKDEW